MVYDFLIDLKQNKRNDTFKTNLCLVVGKHKHTLLLPV